MCDSTRSTLDELCRRNFRCGEIIRENAEVPLKKYLCQSVQPRTDESFWQNSLREDLATILASNLSAKHADFEAAFLRERFLQAPVLSMVTHSHLLFEEDVFLSIYLQQLACREAHQSFVFGRMCSRIRASMRPKDLYGPAYLHLPSDTYRILNRSRSNMSRSSVLAMRNVVCELEPEGVVTPRYANAPLPILLESNRGRRFANGEDLYLETNRSIWTELKIKSRKPLCFIGEEVTSRFLVQQIRKGTGPIMRLLFDEAVRTAFLAARDRSFSPKRCRIFQPGTDFFLFRRNERLMQVSLETRDRITRLVLKEGGAEVPLDYTPAGICEALEEGTLYADLILSYLALVVLPHTIALGGPSQCEYLPALDEALKTTQQQTPFLEPDLFEEIRRGSRGRLFGTSLLELSPREHNFVRTLSPESDFDEFERAVCERTLFASAGSLRKARYLIDTLPEC